MSFFTTNCRITLRGSCLFPAPTTWSLPDAAWQHILIYGEEGVFPSTHCMCGVQNMLTCILSYVTRLTQQCYRPTPHPQFLAPVSRKFFSSRIGIRYHFPVRSMSFSSSISFVNTVGVLIPKRIQKAHHQKYVICS